MVLLSRNVGSKKIERLGSRWYAPPRPRSSDGIGTAPVAATPSVVNGVFAPMPLHQTTPAPTSPTRSKPGAMRNR